MVLIWRGWGELHPFVAGFASAKGVNLATVYIVGIVGVSLLLATVFGLRKREEVRG